MRSYSLMQEVLKFVMYVTYCHTSIKIWNLTPETQLSIDFYYRVSIKYSIMV